MEQLTDLFGFLVGKELSVPLWQIISYAVIIGFCLLFGRHTLGLVISYCFVIFWSFVYNLHSITVMLHDTAWGLTIYAVSGIAMLIIASVGFFIGNKK